MMGSSSLFSVLEILLKGTMPALVSGALIYAGLAIGNAYAWIPIFISIAVCIVIFTYRVRKEWDREIEDLKKGMAISPAAQVLEEYKQLLNKKREHSGSHTVSS